MFGAFMKNMLVAFGCKTVHKQSGSLHRLVVRVAEAYDGLRNKRIQYVINSHSL